MVEFRISEKNSWDTSLVDNLDEHIIIFVRVCLGYLPFCLSVRVCVREREREREKHTSLRKRKVSATAQTTQLSFSVLPLFCPTYLSLCRQTYTQAFSSYMIFVFIQSTFSSHLQGSTEKYQSSSDLLLASYNTVGQNTRIFLSLSFFKILQNIFLFYSSSSSSIE